MFSMDMARTASMTAQCRPQEQAVIALHESKRCKTGDISDDTMNASLEMQTLNERMISSLKKLEKRGGIFQHMNDAKCTANITWSSISFAWIQQRTFGGFLKAEVRATKLPPAKNS